MKQSLISSPSSNQQVQEAFAGLEITVQTLQKPAELQKVIDAATARLISLTGDEEGARPLVSEHIFEQTGRLLGFEEHDGRALEYFNKQPYMILTESGSVMLCTAFENNPGSVNATSILNQNNASGRQEGPCVFTVLKVGQGARYVGPVREEDQELVRRIAHKPDQSVATEYLTAVVKRILVRPSLPTPVRQDQDDGESLVITRMGDVRKFALEAVTTFHEDAGVVPPPVPPSGPSLTDSAEARLGWRQTVAISQDIVASAGARDLMEQIREEQPDLSEQSTDQAFRIQSPAGPAADLEKATQLLAAVQFAPDGRAPRTNGVSEENTAFLNTSALIGTAGEHPVLQPGGYPDLHRERFSLSQLETALLAAQQVRAGNSSTLRTQIETPALRRPSPLAIPPPEESSEALTRLADSRDMLDPATEPQGAWTRFKKWLGLGK